MALPSVGQAQMPADQFALLIKRIRPASVALAGCAGGNELDRIDPDQVGRVVAVDINPKYLEAARARHAKRLKQLQLICADIQSKELHFEPVDLIYAALIFEYVEVLPTIAVMKRPCRGGGTLATVLQLPSSHQSAVSPSPYESLSRLAGFMSLVAPSTLSKIAVAAGSPRRHRTSSNYPGESPFVCRLIGWTRKRRGRRGFWGTRGPTKAMFRGVQCQPWAEARI